MKTLKTIYQTSLPQTGDNKVSVLQNNGQVLAGSNGYFFSLSPDGTIALTNSLKDRGNYEVRFVVSSDGKTAYLGTDGYVIAVDTSTLDTIWQTSLPKTSDNVVNVLLTDKYLYAGSNGFVFQLALDNGSIEGDNDLPDRGNHEVRLAISPDGNSLYVGTDGYALALDAETMNTTWQTSLPHTGDNKISVTCTNEQVYAAGNGFVYGLDTAGSLIHSNGLPNRGNYEVRIALSADNSTLFVGTDGYAISLTANHLVTNWQISLPHTGSNTVNVLPSDKFLYCGANGYVYQLDLSKSGDIVGHNNLPSRGNHEVRLALSSDLNELFVGTDGYALAIESDYNS